MNIVFMGTPEFAVPSLKKLIDKFDVIAVFTQPDRPKGRGKKLAVSPVKEVAVENNIKVYQPVKLRKEIEYLDELKEIKPDFIIVVAYGQILPKEVLDIPKYACINLHASLLPKYRGAAPLNWAIISGEKVSGNTSMLMDVGLDTGDMLLKQEVAISEQMTAGELHDILKEKGSELLLKTIEGVYNGEIIPTKQDDTMSCYAPMLNKELAKIDWTKKAEDINNLIRGLNPWPVTHTSLDNKTMKIFKAEVLVKDCNELPGTIIAVSENGIEVSCGNGTLLIKRIQFPGKKALDVIDYLKGNSVEKGKVLI
ncbi:methionyl-tRNA formyltransferase [Clostridium sp. DL1XJH146]